MKVLPLLLSFACPKESNKENGTRGKLTASHLHKLKIRNSSRILGTQTTGFSLRLFDASPFVSFPKGKEKTIFKGRSKSKAIIRDIYNNIISYCDLVFCLTDDENTFYADDIPYAFCKIAGAYLQPAQRYSACE